MPNANYVKGRKKEYKIVHEEKAKGRIAQRTAGSHSPVDVISIDVHTRIIRLIQAKPDTLSEKAQSKLYEDNIKLNGSFDVVFEVR